MGTHGASVRPRALPPARRADKTDKSTTVDAKAKSRRNLNLTDWPVARRLFTVIVAALLMGLIFGGLRVADAETSANQFSRTLQLAKLSAQLIGVSQDLQNEEDATDVALITGGQKEALPTLQALQALQTKTNTDLVPVRASLQQVLSGGFNATIVSDASAVNNALSVSNIGPAISPSNPTAVTTGLHGLFGTAATDGEVVAPQYEAVLADITTLQAEVSLGITDQSLNNDVQTLGSLSQAGDLTSQELTTLDQSLANTQGPADIPVGTLPFASETSLQLNYDEELTAEAAFHSTATPAELTEFDDLLGPQASKLDGETEADNIVNAFFAVVGGQASVTNANGQTPEENGSGVVLQPFINDQLNGTAANPGVLNLAGSIEQNDQTNGKPAPQSAIQSAMAVQRSEAVTGVPSLKAAVDKGTDAKLAALHTTEQFVADNIVSRATQLQQSAQSTALTYIIITLGVLLVVLLLALLVARSLVQPLRRLRAGALDIASVQLPERVRLLSDNPESASTMEVAPINVVSLDEIGQVARAFDQVHSEAVRLAGEQALLRSSFNAMFVNLSRRSQTLIERLARMIDTLEQNEDDPDRLGSLFSMDHLVTRMRRNSENLLLLAGHENPRKWSESVSIADIARAATSEIEQYNRVTLNIPPGISVIGQAVSDVVHLLAELIENATIFSPKDTQVHVSMQELSSGGVLIEVVDKGIGVSEARLTDMNWRLDNPPTIDVSVSRHMGLFAVARLAERHRVRVRLRPAPPQGLSALVWLPDSVIERTNRLSGGGTSNWTAQPVGARAHVGGGDTAALTTGTMTAGGGSVGLATDYGTGDYSTGTSYSGGSSYSGGNGRTSGNGHSTGNGHGNGASEGRTAKGWFRAGQDVPSQPPAGLGGALGGGGGFFSEAPIAGDQTASGLPVRVPRANMPPGTAPSSPPPEPQGNGGLPTRSAGASDRAAGPGNGQGNAGGGGTGLPTRSPEQARNRLSGFQRGTRRAEGQGGSTGQAPRAGEGTDR
jgi:signal transduction histidine kinase